MNWYLQAFKQYAEFNGRARRKEFWIFLLIHSILIYGTSSLSAILEVPALQFATTIYVFATLVPFWALAVRRVQDIGKSAKHLLIPFYNIYLCCLEGQYTDNQYGENPKKREDVILRKV